MIIDTWANHPTHLKWLLNSRLPNNEYLRPKWVVASGDRNADIAFINSTTAWEKWFDEQGIYAHICLVSCVVVFMNDEDLAMFKLRWL